MIGHTKLFFESSHTLKTIMVHTRDTYWYRKFLVQRSSLALYSHIIFTSNTLKCRSFSERTCAIYDHVTVGNSLSVHSDLRRVFTNVIEKIILFRCLPKVNSILEYTSIKQATACNIQFDYQ